LPFLFKRMKRYTFGLAWLAIDSAYEWHEFRMANSEFGIDSYENRRGLYYTHLWRAILHDVLSNMASHADIAEFLEFFIRNRAQYHREFLEYPEIADEIDPGLNLQILSSSFLAEDPEADLIVSYAEEIADSEPSEEGAATSSSDVSELPTSTKRVQFFGGRTDMVAALMAMFTEMKIQGIISDIPPVNVMVHLFEPTHKRTKRTERMKTTNFTSVVHKITTAQLPKSELSVSISPNIHAFIKNHVNASESNIFGNIAISK
jgi:hypothetical protein